MFRSLLTVCFAIALISAALNPATAADDLPARVRAAKSAFQPRTPQDVVLAKEKLVAAAKPVTEMLNGSANGRAWKEFFEWPRMEAQLAPDATVNLAELEAIQKKLNLDFASLEWSMYVDLRIALRWYLRVARDAANENGATEFQTRLETLAESLTKFSQQPSVALANEIGGHLGWLEEGRQAPELQSELRAQFVRPNLFFQVSQKAISEIGQQPVNMVKPVTDTISGAAISGTSRTIGELTMSLVPQESEAVFETRFEGNTNSQTVAVRGPVSVDTDSQSTISSRLRVGLSASDGFKVATPETKADTRNTTTGVRGRAILGGLISEQTVTNRARAELAANKERNDREATQRTEVKFSKWMVDEFEARLKPINEAYLERLRYPLVRTSLFPRDLQVRTTADSFVVTAAVHHPWQAAATNAPPTLTGSPRYSLQVHQSVVENVADKWLAGKKLDRQKLLSMWSTLLGRTPSDDAVDSGVLLDDRDPVDFRMEEGAIAVTVHGRPITAGKPEEESTEWKFRYQLVRDGDDLVASVASWPDALRELRPKEDESLRVRDFVTKNVGEGPMAKSFAKQFVTLKLSTFVLRDGWLAVAWE